MNNRILSLVAIALFVLNSQVDAHFIWVSKSNGTDKVKIYFGEGVYPDRAQFLSGLKDMKVWSVDKTGKSTACEFEMKTEAEDGWYETTANSMAVDVDCEYGIFSRGGKNMFLHYSAKYVDLVPGIKTKSTGKLPVDITFISKNSETTFNVVHKSKPAASCEFQIVDEEKNTHELKTDEQGNVVFKAMPKGQWLVRAKITDKTAGKVDDKSYAEKRYYCTLVIGSPATATSSKSTAAEAQIVDKPLVSSTPFPELPVGVTSFGGAVVGNHLYVYGGHCGNAHDYYTTGQNSKLFRIDVNSPEKWDTVSDSKGMQGLAMVAHAGNLYRVGGFVAKNAEGEPQDLHSSEEFAKFNLEKGVWEQLQPMPTARSSVDAVVVGDKLFVVGGWTMRGKGTKPEWCSQFLSIDLSDPKAKWNSLDAPFKRRALSTGFQDNKLYAVGGMQEKGGPTSEVKVYDIDAKKWSDGPKLPGSGSMEGFGSSCFNIDGRLVVSTYSGDILKLSKAGDAWAKIHKLKTGRFFHRLLPLTSEKFMLVGGANMDVGKLTEIEVFSFN